jgi:hypothetical protein
MADTLTALRTRMHAEGWTATSPDQLDDEAEQMATEDRRTER